MSESPMVKCMDCSAPAMLDRIPGKKSKSLFTIFLGLAP